MSNEDCHIIIYEKALKIQKKAIWQES